MLSSKNLEENARKIVNIAQNDGATIIGFSNYWQEQQIHDYIKDHLQISLHEGQWRELWFDLMAWSIGFNINQKGAGRCLPDYLAESQKKIIFVIDGLEDIFQELSTNAAQQKALRALLQDVPEWLSQQPSRCMGLIVFVRRDMVYAAVLQNAAQLIARYDPYALKWNPEEALRLVAWICYQAKIIPEWDIKEDEISEISQHKLEELLVKLWGRKLGQDRSKEARSSEWVVAALSDFRGQIQARDLVRLLWMAARLSIDEERWIDRILAPSAMRRALNECSNEKIYEIGVENSSLRDIFDHLRPLPIEKKQIPFTPEQVNLSHDQTQTLEDNGVVLRVDDEYYMPEIFRLGLGFQLAQGARPKVLSLARRARKLL